jgi:LPXTG-site transpeptidase (sortase) family protein
MWSQILFAEVFMAEGRRRALKIAGIFLITVAVFAIGYAAYNLISAEVESRKSLADVDQMLLELQNERSNPIDQDDPLYPDPEDPQDAQNTGSAIDDFDDDIHYDEDLGTLPPAGVLVTPKPNGGGTVSKKPYLGKLIFDSLGKRQVAVLEGATAENLNKGAVHHPRSSPAGGSGNCVIYGHRNTVFRSFNKLKEGDVVRLETPGNTYSYSVSSMAVVEPGDPAIFKARGQQVMTLVTCYPFSYTGHAPQRYIVVCVLQ